MIDTQTLALIKKADFLSSLGAGILGAGIALLWANSLAEFALPILLVGLLSHSLGMFQKHHLEQGENVHIWWAEFLYWFCWVVLVALMAYIALRQF
jgi:hypothetical protein